MSKRLLVLDSLLAVASILLAIQIGRVLTAPARPPKPRPPAQATAPTVSVPRDAPAEAHQPMSSYSLIAAKSLFSPSRSEAPVTPTTVAAAPPAPVFLYGVIVRGDLSVAYLEDPTSKRVAGYRVGDPIAGGVVETIAGDHVVLKRGDGSVNVRLRDPQKPRPSPAPAGGPAAPAVSAPAGQPSVRRGVQVPGAPQGPGALRRRLPPAAATAPSAPAGLAAPPPAAPVVPEPPQAPETPDDE